MSSVVYKALVLPSQCGTSLKAIPVPELSVTWAKASVASKLHLLPSPASFTLAQGRFPIHGLQGNRHLKCLFLETHPPHTP